MLKINTNFVLTVISTEHLNVNNKFYCKWFEMSFAKLSMQFYGTLGKYCVNINKRSKHQKLPRQITLIQTDKIMICKTTDI